MNDRAVFVFVIVTVIVCDCVCVFVCVFIWKNGQSLYFLMQN